MNLWTWATRSTSCNALQRRGALPGWNGFRPHEVELRSDEFVKSQAPLVPQRPRSDPRPVSKAAGKLRGTTLSDELKGAARFNGITEVPPMERTCYHEAGHAVIARHLDGFEVEKAEVGFTPRNVFVGVPGGLPEGLTRYRSPQDGQFPVRENVQSLLAGKVAELLRCAWVDEDAETTDDIRRARTAEPDDHVLGELWRVTRRTLIDHWPEVELVAQALRDNWTLSGRQIDLLVAA
jgi:hypothetical protein